MATVNCSYVVTRAKERFLSSNGSTTILVGALILPLLIFIFSLVFDLEKYFSDRENTQQLLDSAAMHAARFLPYTDQAKQAAQDYISSRVRGDALINIDTSSADTISISVESVSKLIFATLLGVDIGLPLHLRANARITPRDALLVLDTSRYMGPSAELGPAWGDAGIWGANDFFTNQLGLVGDARLLTQQCFNPNFSALKKAAVTLYDYLSSQRLNSVAIGFSPGGSGAYHQSRQLLPGGFTNYPAAGEASFERYNATNASNEWCLASLERELNPNFSLPSLRSELHSPSIPPPERVYPLLPDAASATEWVLPLENHPYLTAREVIWSKAVNQDSNMRIVDILNSIMAELVYPVALNSRGGLAGSASKVAIIFAGDVPWHFDLGANASYRFPDGPIVAEMSSLLDQIQSNDIKLYYLLFSHEGNTAEFSTRVADLKTFLGSWSNIELFVGDDPEDISTEMTKAIVLKDRNVMLSR